MRRLAPLVLSLVGLCYFSSRALAETGSSLQTAYKREFAFLEAEKQTLKKRVADLASEIQNKTGAAQAEVDQLQSRVMAVSLEADRLEDLLHQTQMEADSSEQTEDVLGGVLQQMATALEKGGIHFPEVGKTGDKAKAGDAKKQAAAGDDDPSAANETEKAQLAQVKFGITHGLDLLRRYGELRKTEGKFFSAAGKEVEGTILEVGNVASYGVADGVAGALAPAGQQRLKVWPEQPSGETARALAAGRDPGLMKIFLYESLEKDIEAKQEKTALSIIQSGGVIAWVIVGLGGVAVLMIMLRAFFLFFAAANTDKLVARLSPLLEQGKVGDAIDVCKREKNASGRVLKATLTHINSPRDHLEDVISESILHEQPFLDRFGSTILVIAAVAPLLGLLGTVTGMISTFDVITEFGTGNPKLLSGGISEALVTTELGLVVAIPALLFGNLLGGWASGIKDSLDKAALRVTNIAAGVRLSAPPPQPGEPEAGVLAAS